LRQRAQNPVDFVPAVAAFTPGRIVEKSPENPSFQLTMFRGQF
jgi:hypothetical protein